MINKKMIKRGQSETVGFVLIIIIVTIIILVFLYFIFSNKTSISTTSADMSNLLSAFNEYTTSCTFIPNLPQYKTGQELIQDCYSNGGEMCVDGRNVCQALNYTLKKVIGDTLEVGPDSPNKAYRIRITYLIRGSNNDTWFKMQEGSFINCTERYGGSSIVSANPGTLETRLEVCRARRGD